MSEQVDRRLLLGAAGLAGAAALSRIAHAGPLDPPAGPVLPGGRTTSEIWDKIARTDVGLAEARTPISPSTTPGDLTATYRITSSGSYYLTSNLTGLSSRVMILVTAENVTIDLNGFVLNGGSGATAGVQATGLADRVTVCNGTIRGVAGPAVSLLRSSRVHHLSVGTCVSGLIGGDGLLLHHCALLNIGSSAVAEPVGIEGGIGSHISDCTINSVFFGSRAGAAVRTGSGSSVSRCAVSMPHALTVVRGIEVGFSSLVEDNVVRASETNGYVAVDSGGGIVRRNMLSAPNSAGMTGVQVTGSCYVTDNMIENYDTGIQLGAVADNVVIRNCIRNASTAVATTAPASNAIGPLVTPATIAASNNPHANYNL